MPERSTDSEVVHILQHYRVIAVLGAYHESYRPACYVPEYMFAQGYRILPVNPALVGRTLWGEPVRESLAQAAAECDEPIEMVNVFRRAEWLPAHVPDILAMAPAPTLVWLQLGIRHPAVTVTLVEAGLDVVQDRCLLADHKRLL